MKPQREGIISAMFTDAERVEMATAESRQWYGAGGWTDDDGRNRAWMNPTVAYRPRPKPAKSWQDEFEEWAKGKVICRRDGEAICFSEWHSKTNGMFVAHHIHENGELLFREANTTDWHEAEEYIEPYTQETLPWPLVVRIVCDHMITASADKQVQIGGAWYSYESLAVHKTPTGEPCGIRKWRKKTEAAK